MFGCQLGKVSVYAGGEEAGGPAREMEVNGDDGERAPHAASIGLLVVCGDDFALLAGAISDGGTVCHPVTSGMGLSTDRRCISADAGSEPRRTK